MEMGKKYIFELNCARITAWNPLNYNRAIQRTCITSIAKIHLIMRSPPSTIQIIIRRFNCRREGWRTVRNAEEKVNAWAVFTNKMWLSLILLSGQAFEGNSFHKTKLNLPSTESSGTLNFNSCDSK